MGTQNQQMTLDDLNGLPYSPALLLDARLNASITDSPEFRASCEWGFNSCLEDIQDGEFGWMKNGVRAFVRREMLEVDPFFRQPPLVVRVGVVLGWLSGLALVQYQEAKAGLKELMALTARPENE